MRTTNPRLNYSYLTKGEAERGEGWSGWAVVSSPRWRMESPNWGIWHWAGSSQKAGSRQLMFGLHLWKPASSFVILSRIAEHPACSLGIPWLTVKYGPCPPRIFSLEKEPEQWTGRCDRPRGVEEAQGEVPDLEKASPWESHMDTAIWRMSRIYPGVGVWQGSQSTGEGLQARERLLHLSDVLLRETFLTAHISWEATTHFTVSHPICVVVHTPSNGPPLTAPLFSQFFLFHGILVGSLPWIYSMYWQNTKSGAISKIKITLA